MNNIKTDPILNVLYLISVKKTILILFVSIFCINHALSQKFSTKLTEKDQLQFKQQAIDLIENLGMWFNIVSNASNSQKDKAIKLALKFFSEEAIIQTSNSSGAIKDWNPDVYLNKIVGNYRNRYEFTSIDFVNFDVDELEEIRKDGEVYYKIEFNYSQVWKAYSRSNTSINTKEDINNLELVIVDTTEKEGVIYVRKKTDAFGSRWIMLIDKILVVSTRVKKE